MASKHDEYMHGKTRDEVTAWLKNLFVTSDVVWGVWNDPIEGAGMFPLKGDELFKQATTSGSVGTLRMSAVRCTPEEGRIAQRAAKLAEGEIEL